MVARLEDDFRGVSCLDFVSQLEGQAEHRIEDVPLNPGARELIMAQAMPRMRALGRSVMRVRLFAREAAGERLLGEYTFAHTPAGS